jgi:hypothetical protein
MAAIPLGSTELLGTGKQKLGALANVVVVYLSLAEIIPLRSTELQRRGDTLPESGTVAFLLFLPGCDSLRIHRAAGDREAELSAVAIVIVARVVCSNLLVFFGENLDTCWDKNGKSVLGCF